MVIGWTLACTLGSREEVTRDTDQFAPDLTAAGEEPIGPKGHLPSDLRGIWVAAIRPADRRRLDVSEAGRDGEALGRLDPPLRASEQEWFLGVSNHLSEHYQWYFCATHCRVEIRDSGIWIEGYLIYDRLGSGLVNTRIEGRDVFYELEGHDPNGREGVIHLRMNKDWTEFRVIHVEVDGFTMPNLEDLLLFHYYRRTPDVR